MSAIIPFDFSAPTPAAAPRRTRLNADVISHSAGFPTISIKGKVFAIVKGDERKPLMRMVDGDKIPVASLNLAVVRANTKSRVFYAKSYNEGDSDGAKPTCFSHDGQHPDSAAEQPQAKNCQLCPHAQWGSKVSTDGSAAKGTACTVNTRLAVLDPAERLSDDKPKHTVYLLRVPAGSRANFSGAVSQADNAGKDYNEVAFKIGFDPEAPSPKLTFRPVGLLSEDVQERVSALFDDPAVKDIVGHPTTRPAEVVASAPAALPPAPEAPALLTADDVVEAPAPKPAPKPRAKAAPKVEDAVLVTEDDIVQTAAPKAAPAPAPAPAVDTSSKASALLGDLESMLGMTDD